MNKKGRGSGKAERRQVNKQRKIIKHFPLQHKNATMFAKSKPLTKLQVCTFRYAETMICPNSNAQAMQKCIYIKHAPINTVKSLAGKATV